MLIEDDPDDVFLIQEMIESVCGLFYCFEMAHVNRLNGGLHYIQEHQVDIILSDLGLPDSHGLETVVTLQQQAPTIPLVVLTGLADEAVGMEAVKLGAQDYLLKGEVERGVLIRALSYAIERKKEQEELRRKNMELAILFDISQKINQSIDLHETLAEILEAITGIETLGFDPKGILFLVKGDRLVLAHQSGHAPDVLPQFLEDHHSIDFNTCLCGLAARTGEIIISKDSATDPRHTLQYPQIPDHGHVIVPLQAKRRLVGVLCLYLPPNTEVSKATRGLLITLGNQIGMAIDNATLYEETRALSLHDPLTGFANRRHMAFTMEDNFSTARRFGTAFSIIMFDIDHFKKYNDTHGHDEGDRILKQAATVVSHQLREIDLKVRFGGEEFLIILPNTTKDLAREVAERIRAAVEQEVGITISLGVATYREGDTQESLIKRGDAAMYQAKQQGRNCVVMG